MVRKSASSPKVKVVEKTVYIKTVDGSVLRGKINIGSSDRLSDVFVKGKTPFVVLYGAGTPEGPPKVLVINKNHIVWVEPDEA
jgi:hypothetical protein